MARTIAEIQNEILVEKQKKDALNGLTNDSKTSIWGLWTYIVASAIWLHEKIVERNALISRPHTLNWYREQALNYLHGKKLIWKEGAFQFEELKENELQVIDTYKIIKHCAVSEVDLSSILSPKKDIDQIFTDYFHNQVGVVFMKVAKNEGELIVPLNKEELYPFKEYIAKIKDAGNQVVVQSWKGDKLTLEFNIFVDPLTIYINPSDIPQYQKLIKGETVSHDFDELNGALIANNDVKPVEKAIKDYLRNIEFNGAFVKSFLIDAIQKAEGVKIPVLTKVSTAIANENNNLENQLQDTTKIEYFIPRAGYFDLDEENLNIKINYIPYTFYRDNRTS